MKVMIWKTLIVAILLVGFVILALDIKLLFDRNATFTHHSCALDEGDSDSNLGCSNCEIKEDANCEIKEK